MFLFKSDTLCAIDYNAAIKKQYIKKIFRGMLLTFICPDVNCLEIKPLGDCAHVVTKEPKIKESQL